METAVIQRTTRPSSPESIDEDLGTLWRVVARDNPLDRAVMDNLIVFVSETHDRAADVPLDDVIRRHPSRVVVLRHRHGGAIDVGPSETTIGIVSFGPPHARYGVEEIALRATFVDAALPSIVRRVTRGDVPTSLWWTADCSEAAPSMALAMMSRQVVYDSRLWRDVAAGIAAIAPLLHERNAPRLADINWRRLTAMRHALVHAAKTLLPPGATLPEVEIRYRPGDAALAWLLAGWLASRLRWPDDAWPVKVIEVRHEDDVLAIFAAPVVATMNERRIVVRTTGGSDAFQMSARPESTAEAIAAELATLALDLHLRDALIALERSVALR
jgi:glucose-6-phosphate dehydrogenase assembly protein OpcA